MEDQKHPTFGNGKICYLEIPALDIKQSASFYQIAFGWLLREHEDGSIAFDDSVGEVSGTWVTGRKPATEPGILISIMVDNIAKAVEMIVANGGKLLQPFVIDISTKVASFSDPAGNVFCLYRHQS